MPSDVGRLMLAGEHWLVGQVLRKNNRTETVANIRFLFPNGIYFRTSTMSMRRRLRRVDVESLYAQARRTRAKIE